MPSITMSLNISSNCFFLQLIGRRSGDASHFELGMAIAQATESADDRTGKGALP
jgi:hypothetical protein